MKRDEDAEAPNRFEKEQLQAELELEKEKMKTGLLQSNVALLGLLNRNMAHLEKEQEVKAQLLEDKHRSEVEGLEDQIHQLYMCHR